MAGAHVSLPLALRQESSTKRPTDSTSEETVDPLKLVFSDRMSRLIQEDRLRRSNLSAGRKRIPVPPSSARFSLSLLLVTLRSRSPTLSRRHNFMLHARSTFSSFPAPLAAFPLRVLAFPVIRDFAIAVPLREVKRRIKSEAQGVTHRKIY